MRGRKPGGKNARVTMPMIRRMCELRNAGLSTEAVARVISLDYGEQIAGPTVRHHTREAGARGFTRLGIAGVTTRSGS